MSYAMPQATWNRPLLPSQSATNDRLMRPALAQQSIGAGDILILYALRLSPNGHRQALRSPIRVHIDIEDQEYIVGDRLFVMYGHGPSLNAALEDYSATLLEYYDILIEREQQGVLARNERVHLEALDNLLQEQEASTQPSRAYAS